MPGASRNDPPRVTEIPVPPGPGTPVVTHSAALPRRSKRPSASAAFVPTGCVRADRVAAVPRERVDSIWRRRVLPDGERGGMRPFGFGGQPILLSGLRREPGGKGLSRRPGDADSRVARVTPAVVGRTVGLRRARDRVRAATAFRLVEAERVDVVHVPRHFGPANQEGLDLHRLPVERHRAARHRDHFKRDDCARDGLAIGLRGARRRLRQERRCERAHERGQVC